MPDLNEIQAAAAEHTRRLAAARFATVQILAKRWGVSEDTVRAIPRAQLPYMEFGESHMRRYDPADVAAYEALSKDGKAA
jgi:hypothetical protein